MAAKTKTKEGYVTVNLPAPEEVNDPNFEFVSVNGKAYKIKKGEPVKVPYAVAEVLANAREAKKEERDYVARMVK